MIIGETVWRPLPVDSESESISWDTDYEKKYRNPQPSGYKGTGGYWPRVNETGGELSLFPAESDGIDFWLLEYFPPVQCVPSDNFPSRADGSPDWSPLYVAWRRDRDGNKIVDCTGWTNAESAVWRACKGKGCYDFGREKLSACHTTHYTGMYTVPQTMYSARHG